MNLYQYMILKPVLAVLVLLTVDIVTSNGMFSHGMFLKN